MKKLALREIDKDLSEALYWNGKNIGIYEKNIEGVCLAISGANDGVNWYWIIQMTNIYKDKYWLLEGWCDYTGWS